MPENVSGSLLKLTERKEWQLHLAAESFCKVEQWIRISMIERLECCRCTAQLQLVAPNLSIYIEYLITHDWQIQTIIWGCIHSQDQWLFTNTKQRIRQTVADADIWDFDAWLLPTFVILPPMYLKINLIYNFWLNYYTKSWNFFQIRAEFGVA